MLLIRKNKKGQLNRAIIDTAKEALPVVVAAIRHAEGSVENSLRLEDGSVSKGSHKLDAAVEFLNEHINLPLIPEAVEGAIFRVVVTIVVEVAQAIASEHGSKDVWLTALEDALPHAEPDATPTATV